MRLQLLIFLLPFVVNVNAVLLTKYSNIKDQRDISAIFPERRTIQTTHGVPSSSEKPIIMLNLDPSSPSTELSERLPIEYNVFTAAEPATSEISTADLVDQPASVPNSPEVEASSQPQTDSAQLITVSDPNPTLQPQPQRRALAYQGDHNQLPSYKYPIFFRKSNLKDYVCNEYENIFYSVVNQCDHFVECKNREAMEFICPDGLYFNPEAEWREYPCADPALVVCRTETITTTPPPIEVPQPLPQYKCPDANNYYAIEDQCNSFIECKQFSAMKFSCPDNLLFDREANWPGYPCNNASQVRCGQPTPVPTPPTPPIVDPLPQTTARTTHLPVTTPNTPRPYPPQPTTGLPPTRPPPPTPIPNPPTPKFVPTPEPGKNEWVDPKHDYICYEENKYYPLPNDCNSFIECKQFVPKLFSCPDGLQFNPRAIWLQYPCAEPAEVQCRIPIQTTTTVVPDVEPDVIPNYICADKNRYYSVNHDCESFIECKDYVAHGWKCADGLQFNINARYPDYPCAPPSIAKCGIIPDKEVSAHGCPRNEGYFALQDGDCSRYLLCQRGRSQMMHCPAGLVFNDEKSSCDWPENVPGCNSSVFQGITCPAHKDAPMDDRITKFRYGKRCKEYIACHRGSPRLLSCDAGLSFDSESEACIDSKLVINCE